jgi:glycosyltransferase involved in cell wall biosynthesis
MQSYLPAKFIQGKRITENPLVSVITACYYAGHTLQATIDSLRSQTDQRYELIIVDGGSTDNTDKLITDNLPDIDFWISEPDGGMYEAMNKGASVARGMYLSFLNADDTYLPDTIRQVVSCESFGEASVIHGNMIKIKEIDGKKYQRIERPNPEFMPQGMGIFHPSSFVLASAFQQIGGYDTQYKLAADYALFLALWQKGERFHYLDAPLANFSLGGASNAGCGSYREAIQIQKSFRTGTALKTTRLLWKCRFKKLARKFVFALAKITGTLAWIQDNQKSRWA